MSKVCFGRHVRPNMSTGFSFKLEEPCLERSKKFAVGEEFAEDLRLDRLERPEEDVDLTLEIEISLSTARMS